MFKQKRDFNLAKEKIQETINETIESNKDEILYDTIEVIVPRELDYLLITLIQEKYDNKGDLVITYTADAPDDYLQNRLDNPPERTVVIKL